MAELSESTTPEVITELLSRDDFAGAVVKADLSGDLDKAFAYFSDELAEVPSWRKHELLTKAKGRAEGLHDNPAIEE